LTRGESDLSIASLVEVQVDLVGVLGTKLVEGRLVSTTRLQEDRGDPLGGEGITIDDLNVHATSVEDSQDILLLDRDTSLLHDGDVLSNPSESNELVALRDCGTTVINALNEEGSEGNLSIVQMGNKVIEAARTGGLNAEGLAITTEGEEAPRGIKF
jgi:hypothetical protein